MSYHLADASEPHAVWWDGASWSCTCRSVDLTTDLDAERHYHATHGKPMSSDSA